MLKALMLKKKIDDKNVELNSLRAKDEEFEKREAELAESISEATTEEEEKVVEEAVEKFEAEKAQNTEEAKRLEDEIRALTEELEAIEAEYTANKTEQPEVSDDKNEKRNTENKVMIKRDFYEMSSQERDMFFAEDGVKKFLSEVRDAISNKRAISNVGLIIPQNFLPLIEQEIEANSKLLPLVRTESLRGTGRQVIAGSYPEAVWTEMCATLNELSLGFNDVEVDGYKVGGYFAVCNAVLEDNDIELASRLSKALGVSIAKALDKAIVYGTGTKMPLGIVTRLAQTAQPAGYPSTARTWVDLHSSNVVTGTGASGLALFKELATNVQLLINDYYSDGLIWIMNKKTHMKLVVEAMNFNANAAIVSGVADEMPTIGGRIVEESFVPDDNIVFGYGNAYLLAQRAGMALGLSEHAKFIEDKTVFKGTARYDGKPVIPEAFAVCTISTTAPTKSGISFPADSANP